MVDLKNQYLKLKEEIDQEVLEVLESTAFINGPKVKAFQADLEHYLEVDHVIPVANGTDALQVALMALGLQPGDEVIVPAFTYVSTAEVIALLQLRPIMVDVDPDTFNLTPEIVEKAITRDTRAIVPVNLFGQSADLEPIMGIAEDHGLFVVEDNAQAIGAKYTLADGRQKRTGTIGHIGCTSFYPSKNLGAYGDAGAICTPDAELAAKLRMVANHGQQRRYYHDTIGVNSRLDSIQAAILGIKLKHLDAYANARRHAANHYDKAFNEIEGLQTPLRFERSTHVFHQYTLRVKDRRRDDLQKYLQEAGVPSVVYYPVPLHKQEAYKTAIANPEIELPVSEQLCREVLSLPMHTELTEEQLNYIAEKVTAFFE